MAAQKGLDVVVKMNVSGSQTTIGGMRSTSITLNDESVDITCLLYTSDAADE